MRLAVNLIPDNIIKVKDGAVLADLLEAVPGLDGAAVADAHPAAHHYLQGDLHGLTF